MKQWHNRAKSVHFPQCTEDIHWCHQKEEMKLFHWGASGTGSNQTENRYRGAFTMSTLHLPVLWASPPPVHKPLHLKPKDELLALTSLWYSKTSLMKRKRVQKWTHLGSALVNRHHFIPSQLRGFSVREFIRWIYSRDDGWGFELQIYSFKTKIFKCEQASATSISSVLKSKNKWISLCSPSACLWLASDPADMQGTTQSLMYTCRVTQTQTRGTGK